MNYTKKRWKIHGLTIVSLNDEMEIEDLIASHVSPEIIHLLSAAPEMYEALKLMRQGYECGNYSLSISELARQALAKAEGK